MPSIASLEKQQYYGNPRNAFWPLMGRLLDFDPTNYACNVEQITRQHIAIWDVIGECIRPGSLDSSIVKGSERMNAIPQLLAGHASLTRIALNGGTAARLFKRHCLPELDSSQLEIFYLPSTSPANARMNFEEKCNRWTLLFS